MHIIGVTGTNGKTTITYIIESILRAAGQSVGVMGTPEGTRVAIDAIMMLIEGSMHTAVFRFLDRHKVEG
jgi:rRNA processing protein Krr1/Pno1